jgi:rhodanese-related sulfurtransferase
MRRAASVLLEALAVAAVGVGLALAANAISPRGLHLTRNYFPGSPKAASSSTPATATKGTDSMPVNAANAVLARLQQHGLQVAGSNDVVTLFRDPGYQQGTIVFVDARNDRAYQGGHVPGAWQLDHYHAEKFLPTVLPVCLNAQKIVVYCHGGECEDSEFAAITLRDTGVPVQNIYIYAAGINEWKALGLPMETGERGSGVVQP